MSKTVSKSLPSGTAENGIHVHMLDVADGKTENDGAHTHKFMLPDGTVVITDEGGSHIHLVSSYGDDFYLYYDGDHTHRLVLPDGSITYTSVGGAHGHQSQPTSTAFDGVHDHLLVIDENTIIRSLNSKDLYEIMSTTGETDTSSEKSPAASVLAAISRSARACELRLSKDGLHFDFGDASLTLACVVTKDFEHTVDARAAVETWSADVFCGGPAPVIQTAVGAGSLVCKCSLSYGVVRSDSIELFAESDVFTRRMELTATPGGWVCKFSPGLPAVLLAKGEVPSKGTSQLPLGIEKQIPAAVRYWEMDDRAQAQKALDWLVESNFATTGGKEVDVVDGSLALVEVDKTVYEFQPDPTEERGNPTWVRKLMGALPAGIPVVTPFSEDDWRAEAALFRKSDVLLLMDVPTQEELDDVCLVVSKSKFVIGADDTEENRYKLSKLGRLFKVNDAGAFGRLFATNVDVGMSNIVQIRRGADFSVVPQVSTTASTACSEDNIVLKRMEKAIERVRIIQKVNSDERYILGVVAEPDETDTQGDTQSADEIKRAAYTFLEDYRNIGLQHKQFINGSVKIVESYIARADEGSKGDTVYVKKGSWLMAVRVVDDDIWSAVKSGGITGFSFGGYAERVPLERN